MQQHLKYLALFAAGVLLGFWFNPTPTTPVAVPTLPYVHADCGPVEARRAVDSVPVPATAATSPLRQAADEFRIFALSESLQSNLEQPGTTLRKAVRNALNPLDDATLYHLATSMGFISKPQLDSFESPRDAIYRLTEIALDGLVDKQDSGTIEKEPPPGVRPVTFSTQYEPGSRILPSQDFFEQANQSIYAIFSTDGYDRYQVLVKWYRVNPAQMITMKILPIKTATTINYVRHTRPDGWPPGDYRVEIHSADDLMEKLAEGSYSVY